MSFFIKCAVIYFFPCYACICSTELNSTAIDEEEGFACNAPNAFSSLGSVWYPIILRYISTRNMDAVCV